VRIAVPFAATDVTRQDDGQVSAPARVSQVATQPPHHRQA